MKKYYVKTDKGVLVLATQAQIDDESVEKMELEVPDPTHKNDPIEELTGLIRELSGGFNIVKQKQEEMEAQIASYKEAVAKGFPIPVPGAPGGPMFDFGNLENIDLSKQGKRLMDKFFHPGHQIDDSARIELAKYFILFVRAAVQQDPRAMAKMIDTYGPQKTVVGDVGNVFPVPDIVDSEILAFAREKSVVLQYARQWDMTSEKQSFPSESSAVSVAWGNETEEHEPGVTEVELDANELSAYSAVKNATLMDARSDIVSWLAEALAEAAGLELDNQAFNGTGSPFTGLLSSACGYSIVLSGSTFADITADDFSAMIAKLDGLKKMGARFFMNGLILHYVRILKDDNGRPIFYETVGSPTSGTIYGFPYSEVIKMPNTTAASTAFLNFGNLRYLAVGRRLGSTALSVNPYILWTTNRTAWKLYQRWAIKIGLPLGFVRALTSS